MPNRGSNSRRPRRTRRTRRGPGRAARAGLSRRVARRRRLREAAGDEVGRLLLGEIAAERPLVAPDHVAAAGTLLALPRRTAPAAAVGHDLAAAALRRARPDRLLGRCGDGRRRCPVLAGAEHLGSLLAGHLARHATATLPDHEAAARLAAALPR